MRLFTVRIISTASVLACAGFGACVSAQTRAPAQAQALRDAPVAQPGAIEWQSLTASQRAALQPLQRLWPTLGAEHQRKWIALSVNFDRMTPDERNTLQSRMTGWARLTPAERTQARLNFGEVRRVPADQKRAKWEQYQSLPPEVRERLAGDAKPPAGAAPALRPAPPERVLRPLAPPPAAASGAGLRRPPVAPTPLPVDGNTLLPQRAPGMTPGAR